jgi:dihydroorotase
LHAHVYDGFTSLGVDADSVGLKKGVHCIADAGSAGAATLAGLTHYVVPTKQTMLRAWLNVSSIGLVHMNEYSDLRQVNVETAVKAVEANQPFICGIKTRCSGIIVEDKGIFPFQRAVEAARQANVPLMVHVGETPPHPEEFMGFLQQGDVISHCFHGKERVLWNEEGQPIQPLIEAMSRGVILDVAHGAASFDHRIARRAIAAGHRDFVISTDLHIRNLNGPVYDLPTTMTKLMDCGLTLAEVIAAVTLKPAKILGLENWCRMEAGIQRATLFRLREPDAARDVRFFDSFKNPLYPARIIEPAMIVVNGKLESLPS